MSDQFTKAGYTVDLEYANNDVATQVTQLENMITKGAKVLVIAAVDASALQTVLDDAKKAKAVVFAYDRLIKGADYYATFDNYKVGVLQAQWVIKDLKLDTVKGPIATEVFGGSPDDNNAFMFNKGEMDTLKPYIDKGVLVITSKQTSMDVIAIKGWDSGTAQKRMDNLLTAYYADKPVQLVVSPNDSLAQGITASLKAAGYVANDASAKKPFPVITGQDCDVLSVKNMIAGMQSMSIFKDTRTLAAETVKMVGQILTGAAVDVNNTTDYSNVPSFLLDPTAVDLTNYKATLLDSGYYTADQLK
jgi:putative multiple sugar transport system substrate-binding protein